MSKNIEARLAKVEKQIKDIQGKYDQDQKIVDYIKGLQTYMLEEEPTPRQRKAVEERLQQTKKRGN